MTTLISWGSSNCDHECLRQILNEAQMEHLLPPILGYSAKPIAWWRDLRASLGFSGTDLSLRLSHLYWVVFPEDKAFALRAHDAGVDVIMAYRLVFTYLRKVLDLPLPGKLDSFFSATAKARQSDWQLRDKDLDELLARLQQTPARDLATGDRNDQQTLDETFCDNIDDLLVEGEDDEDDATHEDPEDHCHEG